MKDLKFLHFDNPEDLVEYVNSFRVNIVSITDRRTFLVLFYTEYNT